MGLPPAIVSTRTELSQADREPTTASGGRLRRSHNLAKGPATLGGNLVHGRVAEAHGLPFTSPKKKLAKAG